MRFNVEMQGVIDAETEDEARELAERIASDTRKAYRFPTTVSERAVVACFDVEVVIPKQVVA